jgi:hypothetical protein
MSHTEIHIVYNLLNFNTTVVVNQGLSPGWSTDFHCTHHVQPNSEAHLPTMQWITNDFHAQKRM